MLSEYGVPVIFLQAQPQTDWPAIVIAIFAAVGTVTAAAVAVGTFRRSAQPYVIAYIARDEDDGSVLLVVRNIGNGCAWNVSISGFDLSFAGFYPVSDLKMIDYRKKIQGTFIFRGIPMLAPGESRSTVIANMGYASQHLSDKESIITVEYSTAKNSREWRKRREEFALDYYSFANTIYSKSAEWRMATALEKIADKR